MTPHLADLLRCGASVVLDFGGNTIRDRQWVRSIVDGAGAAHVLHYIDADETLCLARIHERNVGQPEGIFFGVVTDAQVAEVNRHFVAPSPEERFNLVVHRARVL